MTTWENERVTRVTETPAEKAEHLAATHSAVIDGPAGMAACGCPNRVDGIPPVLHICRDCGFEGGYDSVHRDCAGCRRLSEVSTLRRYLATALDDIVRGFWAGTDWLAGW